MQAVIFAMDDELGKNDGVIAVDSKVPDPPLDSLSVWTMNDKLLFFCIVGRSCH